MDVESVIKEQFLGILEANNQETKVDFSNDLILLQSGLDSLGFAVLVAKLEDVLGYDPFVIMKEAVYPKTFGEFLDIYKNNNPNKE